MKHLISLLMLCSLSARAECVDREFSHNPQCEHYQLFNDSSQTAHLWAGALLTTGGTVALERAGMKPLAATLSALAVTMILAAAKETMLDGYTSRNGILSMWTGGVVAAPIVFALTF